MFCVPGRHVSVPVYAMCRSDADAAALLFRCSTLADIALCLHTTGKPGWNVSQSISTIYHSPAVLYVPYPTEALLFFWQLRRGDELRIVNTTLTVGSRAVSCRTEVCQGTDDAHIFHPNYANDWHNIQTDMERHPSPSCRIWRPHQDGAVSTPNQAR